MTVLVTGAAQGIGLAVTQHLAEAGYTVLAQFRSKRPEYHHPNVRWWHQEFRADAELELPDLRFEAVVHCAGIARLGTCAATPAEQWREHFEVNVLSPQRITAALLPSLRQHGGHVVAMNSGAGMHTKPEWGAYSASKFALRAWADTLRAEEPEIRVTSIYPGRVDTPMQEQIVGYEGGEYDGSQFIAPSTIAKAVLAALASPRDAQVHDITIRPR